ncbi:MAG: YceI family protein [Gelidibacter sp.]
MKTRLFLLTAFLTYQLTNAQSMLSTNEFLMDLSKSSLKWHGSSMFQFNDHDGTVNFKKGYLKVENGKLWGGSFEVDMTSIVAEDDGPNSGLAKHLKSADFFDVKMYPTAWLSIQKVRSTSEGNYEVEANLNIKGITKPVLFTATLEEVNKRWQLTTKFIIDRSRWNIIYGRNGSGVTDPLKNYSISDAIKFEVTVVTQ